MSSSTATHAPPHGEIHDATSSQHKDVVACPDPAAHQRLAHEKEMRQEATDAARLAGQVIDRQYPPPSQPVLDADGKLSSSSAATSLKYAKPEQLPSFPDNSINTGISAGAAANLANSNQKGIDIWQPEASSNAGKAAMLAHHGPSKDWWQAQSSKEGNSAANIAVKNQRTSPEVYKISNDSHQKALLAATLSVKGRQRADSNPEPAQEQSRRSKTTYNAAAVAEANQFARGQEAARITHLSKKITPKMFTDAPPIAFEVEEKKHDDGLRASAIAMAKSMYNMQEVDNDGNVKMRAEHTAATLAHNRAATNTDNDVQKKALQYLSLQDAAKRLAAERLAKIDNENRLVTAQNYYGQSPQPKTRSRLSIKKSNRHRASSAGEAPRKSRFDNDSDEDEAQANRIRSKQSRFNTQLAGVDQKRDDDRKALLAAAEKKVHAQMHALDKKVYDETGKMSPQMVEDWDAKARARAAANSQARMENHGKVDLGGGMHMDPAAIDAIARARVQPTLDQITDKAQKQRAHDEEVRQDAEERKREAQLEKQKENERKAEAKRLKQQEKDEEKHKKQELKDAHHREKEAEKAKKEEAARRVQAEKDAERKAAAAEKQKEKHEHDEQKEHEHKVAEAQKEEQRVLEAQKEEERRMMKAQEDEEGVVRRAQEEEEKRKHAAVVDTDKSKDAGEEKNDIIAPVAVATSSSALPLGADQDAALNAGTDSVPKDSATTTKDVEASPPTVAGSSAPISIPTNRTKPTAEPTTASPQSPSSKSGFRAILSKLKPVHKKEKSPSTSVGSFSPILGKSATDKGKARAIEKEDDSSKGSFIGGAALANMATSTSHPHPLGANPAHPASASVSSLDSSDRELEPAATTATERGREVTRAQDADVSSVSDEEEEFEEARDTMLPAPNPAFASVKSPSPNRESKFHEEV